MAGRHCPALGRGRLIRGAEGSPCCRRGFTELRSAVLQGNSSGAAWRGPLVCGSQVRTQFHLDIVSSWHVASLWLLPLCAVAESVAPGQGETQGRSAHWSDRRGCENHPEGHQGSLGSSGCPREDGTTGPGMRSAGRGRSGGVTTGRGLEGAGALYPCAWHFLKQLEQPTSLERMWEHLAPDSHCRVTPGPGGLWPSWTCRRWLGSELSGATCPYSLPRAVAEWPSAGV